MVAALGGRVWWIVAVLLGLVACGTSEEKVEKRDDGLAPYCDLDGVTACRNADVCGAGMTCSQNCCLPSCGSASDCDASACGPLGCVCDAGACRDRVCSADVECSGGRVCEAGSCAEPPDPGAAASCSVAPRYAAVHEGGALNLEVKAYDAAGRPLPLSAGFTFTSDATDRVAVDEAGRVVGGAVSGEATVTASIGDASCEALLWNHAALADGGLRVVVTDELTGLPLPGALVQLETGATPLSGTTDASGAARFEAAALPAGARTISVFHEAYTYVTVAGTEALDLHLPVRRLVQADRAGGFRGTFGPDEIFHPDHVLAGVAGTSIPGNVIDLSFSILVGPSQLTTVTIGSERKVKIPSGVVLGLGNTWFKQEYMALGVAGLCADRARTEAGSCGTRTAWGVAGGVPLLDLPIDEITEGGEELEVGALLAQLLPHFQRFKSAVARDVTFDLHPTIVDGEKRVPDWSRFTPLDLEATQRMALRSTVALPELPRLGDGWLDGAIVFGGAHTPDRGVVPLGLTAGVDADTAAGGAPDGVIDDLEGRSVGELPLRIAPLHGGLEGSDYVVLALAANFAGMSSESASCSDDDRRGCAAIAGLLDRSASFPFDRRVDFGGGDFVPPLEAASWSAASRTFTRGAAPAGGANVVRVKLSAGDGRVWHVWMPADATEVVVPQPAGVADRAGSARASVQALRLEVGLEELVGFGGSDLADLVEELSAFSTIDLP